jgi:hypothetical protein
MHDFIGHDRILEREADEYLDHQQRREDAYVKMLNDPTYHRAMNGLPPVGCAYDDEGRLVECTFCPAHEIRYFCGTPICERCAKETTLVCAECGCTDFITHSEGPSMCQGCRSVENYESVDWDDGTPPEVQP